MLPLAKLGQTGARRVVTGSRGTFMKDRRGIFTCLTKCHFIPKTRQIASLFSCSSLNHDRSFTASASHWNQKTPSYGYVIVGAGSAGCVLANRLTEDAHESVLLLEAGPKDMWLSSLRLSWKIHMPAALTYNLCDNKYSNQIMSLFLSLYIKVNHLCFTLTIDPIPSCY